MRETSLGRQLRDFRSNLIGMKSAQAISGDSWKLYRYTGTYSYSAGPKLFLVFTPFNSSIPTTATMLVPNDGLTIGPVGLRLSQGRYAWLANPGESSGTNALYIVTATQQGVISFTTTPPV